ncbi:MAG: hypothetical protein ACTSVY_09430 [Candidatus Helarchaeota archaeon]
MVLIELLSGIVKRLTLTDEELNYIHERSSNADSKSKKEMNKLASLLKQYINMYFDDFFQVRSFPDQDYRKILNEINNEIKKEPETVEMQVENLKQFQSFSKAMQKAIFKVIKNEDALNQG